MSIYYSKRGRSESPTGRNPVEKPKIRNEMIEVELKIFKKEIEEKFYKSSMNKNYKFPLLDLSDDEPRFPSNLPLSNKNMRRTHSIDRFIELKEQIKE